MKVVEQPNILFSVGGGEFNHKSLSVSDISIDQGDQSFDVGGNFDFNATVSPNNASNTAVTWSSSNTNVATVNSNGIVLGVSAGSATITVTTADGGFTDTVNVTVNAINNNTVLDVQLANYLVGCPGPINALDTNIVIELESLGAGVSSVNVL